MHYERMLLTVRVDYRNDVEIVLVQHGTNVPVTGVVLSDKFVSQVFRCLITRHEYKFIDLLV
jgi:hypothetical protein